MLKKLILLTAFFLSFCSNNFSMRAEDENMRFFVGDKEYRLDDKTILLDREGLYNVRGAFIDASEAFRHVNEIGGNITILVAPSVYWLDDPDDPAIRTDKGGTPFAVRLHCDSLSIIGLAENPEDVVLAVNRGQTQGAVGNFTMFEFSGKSLATENVTYGNYCNTDLVYPRNPQLNRTKRKEAIVQAQIGICRGTDRLLARNCRFLSRLNLCPFVGAGRSLFENCYFECTDDALAGSGIYLRCRFTFFSSKPFYSTDPTGAIFLDCDIHSKCQGTQYFTKVPGMITAIDTRFTSEGPLEIAWTRDASDIKCYQHNITLNGKPYVIDAKRPELGPQLSGKKLMDAYRIENEGKVLYNIPNLTNGNDGWDPAGMNEPVALLEKTLGKKLTGLPVALKMTAIPQKLKAIGDTAVITATPLLWGGFNGGIPNKTVFISDNSTPLLQEQTIRSATDAGLEGSVTVEMMPDLRDAPGFAKAPCITYDDTTGQFHVEYQLSGHGEDTSTVIWSRIVKDADGKTQTIPVRISKGMGAEFYKAKAADYLNGIVAAIIPQYADSHPGEIVESEQFEINDVSRILEIPEKTLYTDFADIPIIKRSHGIPGTWCFDIYKPEDTADADWEAGSGSGWEYGNGFDASVGSGILQTAKGARLSYVPVRNDCRNMEVTIVAEPAKSGGQGFGSATCQYMDICVKFNPETLCGYALRIERTPDHDRAVKFSLIKYDNGKTSVINHGVISNCYRTPCFITVGIRDGKLYAKAYTNAAAAKKCCDETDESVDISSAIVDNDCSGFCIQHTGSTGPSSTLLRNVNISWE